MKYHDSRYVFLHGVHRWGDEKISTKFEDCIDIIICYDAIHV